MSTTAREVSPENIELLREPRYRDITKNLTESVFTYLLQSGADESPSFPLRYLLDKVLTTPFKNYQGMPPDTVQAFGDLNLVDLMMACRRAFFALINWLYVGQARQVINHSSIMANIHMILDDRYGWAHLIGSCRSYAEIREMKAIVSDIFRNNSEISAKFNEVTVQNVITEVEQVMYRMGITDGDQQFLATFYRQVCARLFKKPDHAQDYRYHIEKYHISARDKVGVVPQYIQRDHHEVMSLSSFSAKMFRDVGYDEDLIQEIAGVMKYSGRYTRNENTEFMQLVMWRLSNMGLPVIFQRAEADGSIKSAVRHALANIPGEQQELFRTYNNPNGTYANVINPHTTGNCWDLARIMAVYLTLNCKPDPNRTILQVGSKSADHSYIIITKLSRQQVEAYIDPRTGTFSMKALFAADPTARIVDPWAQLTASRPIDGLHYKSDDQVSLHFSANLGMPNSYLAYPSYSSETSDFRRNYRNLQANSRWQDFTREVKSAARGAYAPPVPGPASIHDATPRPDVSVSRPPAVSGSDHTVSSGTTLHPEVRPSRPRPSAPTFENSGLLPRPNIRPPARPSTPYGHSRHSRFGRFGRHERRDSSSRHHSLSGLVHDVVSDVTHLPSRVFDHLTGAPSSDTSVSSLGSGYSTVPVVHAYPATSGVYRRVVNADGTNSYVPERGSPSFTTSSYNVSRGPGRS